MSLACAVGSAAAQEPAGERLLDDAPTTSEQVEQRAQLELGERDVSDGDEGDREPAAYRELVLSAIAARQAGSVTEAVALMERAHALFPNARTLRGLGVLAMDQHRYEDAADYLVAALVATVRPLDEELRAVTNQLLTLARAQVGQVRLTLRPANARVTVDGVAEASPQAFDLTAGDHALLVRADGYLDEARSIAVRGGETIALSIALQLKQEPQVVHKSSRSIWRNPWLWGGVSLVVLGGVVGGVLATRDAPGYERGTSGMLVGAP